MSTSIRPGGLALLLALAACLAPATAQETRQDAGQDAQVETDEEGRRIVRRPRPPVARGEVPAREVGPWTGELAARAGEMLVGSWRSEQPVPVQGETDEAVTVWLHAAKAPIDGLDDVVYLELHRADDAIRPYRQAFVQFYEHDGALRLRTFEPTNLRNGLEAYAGFWAIPDRFPPLSADNVIATMDIPLRSEGDGWGGETPHPYATARFGAVEMRSAIEIRPDRLVVSDRGFDADGTQVWGPPEGGITFVPEEFPLEVTVNDSGLIRLDYPADVSRYPREGDMVRWAYDAWLWETGRKFAGSNVDEVLPEYPHPPPPDQLNNAWGEAIIGAGLGSARRIVTPPELAYGTAGWTLRGVPPNAVLVFHMELVNIETPEVRQEGPAEPADGGTSDGEEQAGDGGR